MARYALVTPSNTVDRFANDGPGGINPAGPTKAGWRWLLANPGTRPVFSPETEIVEGPTVTVGATEVAETYTKRALTAQEISDRKDGEVNGLGAGVLLKALFLLHNRVRALELQPADTVAQFKAKLRALL